MPSLGADMESAILVEWLVKPGDRLKRGDIIAVVETDKGAIEIEVFEDAIVDALLVAEGTQVQVDGLLARLRNAAEPIAEPVAVAKVPVVPVAQPAQTATPIPAPPKPPLAMPTTIPLAVTGGRVAASPAARRKAAEIGVQLGGITGSGVGGAIGLADVVRAAAAPAPPPISHKARGGFDPAAMRRAIAGTMARAKREIPHYYLTQTLNLNAAMTWLEAANRERAVTERLLPAALFLKATALGLARYPQLNGFFEEGAFRPGAGIHIGWAVSLRGGGLLAPAIHDVDRQPISAVMAALRDLVQRARGGGLRSSELMDPTVTVTSLGERGADTVLPIIYPPQVAVIGFGGIAPRPWVKDGSIVAQPLVTVSLAADHRVSDGHGGALLLGEIDRRLQQPEQL